MGAADKVRTNHAGFDELLETESRKRRTASSKIVLVSGGFDPLHVGHVNLIQAASKYGRVVVALNSDAWLKKKKGYVFMKWYERADILRALRDVWEVAAVDDTSGSVYRAILTMKPAYFANGGDRTMSNSNVLEAGACEKTGCEQLFGIGGAKVQSSSALVKR